MPNELPHFLRFARALALVSGVAVTGCGATITSQDVPPTETSPSDGITVAPDRPMVDAGISPSPDVQLGIVASPDTGAPPGIVASPDSGVTAPPDGFVTGVDTGPEDVFFTGVVDAPTDVATGIDAGPDDVIRDGIAPAPDAGLRLDAIGGPQAAPELPWA